MPLLAVLVEGESDYGAIRVLLRQAGITHFACIKFGSQPVECTIPTLVERKLLRFVRLAMLKGAHKIIVLLDREWREQCAPALARDVLDEINRRIATVQRGNSCPCVRVVCPDCCLENWLIADPEGLAGHAYIAKPIGSKVEQRADGKDAIQIIKRAFRRGRSYHKARDAPDLAGYVRVLEPTVRSRSKSLDKFLREVGTPRLA